MAYMQWHEKAKNKSNLDEIVEKSLFALSSWATGDVIIQSLGLRNSKDIRLLDVGCGFGRVINTIHFRLPEIRFWGVELTGPRCAKARTIFSDNDNISIVEGDFLDLDLTLDLFTHIISTRVIHYMTDIEKKRFLLRAYGLLQKGGQIFISIPNRFCPVRWFTYKHAPLLNGIALKTLMQRCGFHVDGFGSYGFLGSAGEKHYQSRFKHLELRLRSLPLVKYLGGLWFACGTKL